jgi:hypothetical protein
MTSLEDFTKFLGWCTVINIAIYLVSALIMALMHAPMSQIHAMMFGLTDVDVLHTYFQYLGHYKIAILVFNLVPYIALKIIKRSK